MLQHEMQQSNIYLNMYIIEYYSFWKNRVLQRTKEFDLERPGKLTNLMRHEPQTLIHSQYLWYAESIGDTFEIKRITSLYVMFFNGTASVHLVK
jgi:hypothetical protein